LRSSAGYRILLAKFECGLRHGQPLPANAIGIGDIECASVPDDFVVGLVFATHHPLLNLAMLEGRSKWSML
jgi:hypothetical protein